MQTRNPLLTAVDKLLEEEAQWWEEKKHVWGLPTGFPSIDNLTGGMHEAELTVFGADTGLGKSSYALQLSEAVAEHILCESIDTGHLTGIILIYSPEMTAEQLVMRMGCQLSGVNSMDVHRGTLTPEERRAWREAVEDIKGLGDVFILRDEANVGLRDIIEDVEELNRSGPPVRLLVIDYLQHLDLGVDEGNRYAGVTKVAKQLKDLSRDENLPILVFSQLNREFKRRLQAAERDQKQSVEDVQPDLDDLRDSGRIGQIADVVILAWKHTDDMGRTVAGRNHTVFVKIEKNRHGPRGIVTMGFNPVLTRFVDYGES